MSRVGSRGGRWLTGPGLGVEKQKPTLGDWTSVMGRGERKSEQSWKPREESVSRRKDICVDSRYENKRDKNREVQVRLDSGKSNISVES